MSVRHASVEGTAGEDLCERVVWIVSPGGTAWALRDEDSTGSVRETEMAPDSGREGPRAVVDTRLIEHSEGHGRAGCDNVIVSPCVAACSVLRHVG